MTPDFMQFLSQALTYLSNLAAVFATLLGVAALVSVMVDIAKRLGLPDGRAPWAAFILNAGCFVILAALGLFTHVTPQQFDQIAQAAATLLTALLGLITMVLGSAGVHAGLKKASVPLLYKSHSEAK